MATSVGTISAKAVLDTGEFLGGVATMDRSLKRMREQFAKDTGVDFNTMRAEMQRQMTPGDMLVDMAGSEAEKNKIALAQMETDYDRWLKNGAAARQQWFDEGAKLGMDELKANKTRWAAMQGHLAAQKGPMEAYFNSIRRLMKVFIGVQLAAGMAEAAFDLFSGSIFDAQKRLEKLPWGLGKMIRFTRELRVRMGDKAATDFTNTMKAADDIMEQSAKRAAKAAKAYREFHAAMEKIKEVQLGWKARTSGTATNSLMQGQMDLNERFADDVNKMFDAAAEMKRKGNGLWKQVWDDANRAAAQMNQERNRQLQEMYRKHHADELRDIRQMESERKREILTSRGQVYAAELMAIRLEYDEKIRVAREAGKRSLAILLDMDRQEADARAAQREKLRQDDLRQDFRKQAGDEMLRQMKLEGFDAVAIAKEKAKRDWENGVAEAMKEQDPIARARKIGLLKQRIANDLREAAMEQEREKFGGNVEVGVARLVARGAMRPALNKAPAPVQVDWANNAMFAEFAQRLFNIGVKLAP